MRTHPIATALCALVTLSGCAGSAAVAEPEATLRAFVDASRRGDTAAAYALLDEGTRARVSLADFEAAREANREELDAAVGALAQRDAEGALGIDAQSEVPLGEGDPVLLHLEQGVYRLDGGFLTLVAPRTPEAAVLALRQALRAGSLPLLLRVLSRRTRAEVEAELAELLALTDDALEIETDSTGDRATIRLGTDRAIDLVREGGEWRVDDIR